jgi:DDE superfamily endonuclease
MRKISRETGISRTAVINIAKNEFNLRPYKLQKAQLLTERMMATRLERSRALLTRTAGQEVLFTDEKIFTVEASHNHQNDRIWSQNAPGTSSIVSHIQHPASVMVWAGICQSGKTPLIFVDHGVNINKNIYLERILQAVVEPWARGHFGNRPWIFQQDSAPAHKARQVQSWCRAHFSGFINAQEWPTYSPDLNPMDYSVWSILEARACAKPHKSLETLRHSLEEEWDRMSLEEVRAIVNNFPKRLRACIEANGGHFEMNC